MAEGQDFTVQVSLGQFVQGVDGNTIDVTCVPSYAKFFRYDDAAQLSARLRRRGHPQSCVCDLSGRIMTFDDLENYRRGLATSTTTSTKVSASDLPSTLKELNALSAEDYRRRRRSDPAFRQRANELEGISS